MRKLAIALVFLSGILTGMAVTEVNCPSEDSCIADYHGGKWHVIPDIP